MHALVLASALAATCPNANVPGEVGAYTHLRREIRLDVSDGSARMTVDDVLENQTDGPAAHEGAVSLEQDLGFVDGALLLIGDVPFAARIDDVDGAAADFRAYVNALAVGVDAAEADKGAPAPALLVAHTDGGVALSAAGPCTVRALTVRTQAVLTSIPLDGSWRFLLPAVDEGIPTMLAVASDKPIQTRLDDQLLHPAEVATLAAADAGHFIDVKPLERARVRARGVASRISPVAPVRGPSADEPAPAADVTLARAELDLPNPLADAPAALRIVFVIDASVSVTAMGVEKQWQLLDQILDAAPPDARYAVVAASRRPAVVVSPWRERADRERPRIEVQNGSDIRRALKLAQGVASDVRHDEELVEVSRIIVLSDMELQFSDDDNAVASSFKGALTHLINLGEGLDIRVPLNWQRAYGEDDPRVAGLERTGGIWVQTGWGDDEEAALAPHLIAPTRLDRPQVFVGDVDAIAHSTARSVTLSPRDEGVSRETDLLPSHLLAGSGIRVNVALAEAKAAPVKVKGLLWSTPLDVAAAVLPERFLVLAVNDGTGDDLAPALVRAVGLKANAVTSETSLLALPQWRPAALELAGIGMSGCGCCGGCGSIGYSCGTRCGVGVGRELRELETLARLLDEDARACGAKSATVEIEFWDLEILDVRAVKASTCVVERTWKRRLDLLEGKVPGAFVGHRRIQVVSAADPG